MARTTQSKVEAILGPNYDKKNNVDLTPFIETASVMIDEVVTCAADDETTLSSSLLERLECLVAAHFYHCADPTYASRSTDGASGQFMGQAAMGLDGSRYGQMAKRMDPSGCLAAMDDPDKGRASITWLGKPVSDQINYWDRN